MSKAEELLQSFFDAPAAYDAFRQAHQIEVSEPYTDIFKCAVFDEHDKLCSFDDKPTSIQVDDQFGETKILWQPNDVLDRSGKPAFVSIGHEDKKVRLEWHEHGKELRSETREFKGPLKAVFKQVLELIR